MKSSEEWTSLEELMQRAVRKEMAALEDLIRRVVYEELGPLENVIQRVMREELDRNVKTIGKELLKSLGYVNSDPSAQEIEVLKEN